MNNNSHCHGSREVNEMRNKELKLKEIPKWGNYLRGQWRES